MGEQDAAPPPIVLSAGDAEIIYCALMWSDGYMETVQAICGPIAPRDYVQSALGIMRTVMTELWGNESAEVE